MRSHKKVLGQHDGFALRQYIERKGQEYTDMIELEGPNSKLSMSLKTWKELSATETSPIKPPEKV